MRSVDWIALWKIYHPLFICGFIVPGLLIRMLVARRLRVARPKLAWLASSTASIIFILSEPLPLFATLPAFALVALAGDRTWMAMSMAIPIAASVGVIEALIDAALIRILLRESISKRRFLVLFAGNATNAAVALAIVLAKLLIAPVEVIAILGNAASAVHSVAR